MRISLSILMIALCTLAKAQPLLKTGDLFPDMIIRNIINAPVKELEAHKSTTKFRMPEFLGHLVQPLPAWDGQPGKVASEQPFEDPGNCYLERACGAGFKNTCNGNLRVSGLASDTASWLYSQFGFNYVGQSAILDQQHRVVALVRTDSINQQLIDKLIRKEKIHSSAETGNRMDVEADPFAVDSALGYQLTWSG